MPMFVLSRNYLLSTTNGTARFEKGVPVWIVPGMVKDALQIGAEPVEGKETLVPEEKVVPKAPQGDDRTAQIYAAFELIVEKNEPKEFTGQGVPTIKAVEKLTGFELDRTEVIDLWHQYKVAKVEQ